MKLEVEINLTKHQEDLLVHIDKFCKEHDYGFYLSMWSDSNEIIVIDDYYKLHEHQLISYDDCGETRLSNLGRLYLEQLIKLL